MSSDGRRLHDSFVKMSVKYIHELDLRSILENWYLMVWVGVLTVCTVSVVIFGPDHVVELIPDSYVVHVGHLQKRETKCIVSVLNPVKPKKWLLFCFWNRNWFNISGGTLSRKRKTINWLDSCRPICFSDIGVVWTGSPEILNVWRFEKRSSCNRLNVLLLWQSKWQQIKLIFIDFFKRISTYHWIDKLFNFIHGHFICFSFSFALWRKNIKLKQNMYEIEMWEKNEI